MWHRNKSTPEPHSRRRFLRAAGMALGGGTAVLGLSGSATAATAATTTGTAGTAVAGAAGSAEAAGMMSAARLMTCSALTESMAGLRTAGDAGKAAARLMEWYAAATPAERADIDGALDAVGALPGAFSALGERDRLKLLAEHLSGPQEAKLTTAIGLAIAGLSASHSGPGNALASGRLYARTIRALPAQAVKKTPEPSATPAPCAAQQS